jgi:hypothetical protein
MNATESKDGLQRDPVASDSHLVNLCRLTRGNPAFKPLVFEALLRTDMLVWLDQSASARGIQTHGLSFEDSDWLPIRRLRYPEGGVAEYAAAFFTDKAHFNAYVREMEPAQRQCCLPHDNQVALNSVVAHRLPLVIDPGSPHHVYLTADQVRDWVTAVELCDRQPMLLPRSREFQAWAAAPLLVERLSAYLGQFEAIERAWVCRLGEREPRLGEGGTLLLSHTGADCHRIRCALPLISYGLTRTQALNWIAPLDRPIDEMPPQRRELLTPVYDRAALPRRWRGPRVWP